MTKVQTEIQSAWGRSIRATQQVVRVTDRHAALPREALAAASILPFGNGRSYGDSCLNIGGALLRTRGLDRFIAFDPATGVLACEAGVLLSEVIRLFTPQGWFPCVTPGTRYVTIGGAIANDVHGKNHHVAGTFGCHVLRFELLRSDGRRLVCSPAQNREWFCSTIGGLGLTGLITWAEIALRRVANPWMDVETVRFRNLDEFFGLCEESDRDYEYTVSWIDCSGGGRRLGRGLFMRANHAAVGAAARERRRPRRLRVPLMPPFSLINPWSLKIFNSLYFHKAAPGVSRAVEHYESFFYPLDGIQDWNRIYGPRGFYQYQCVIPTEGSRVAVHSLLSQIAQAGMGSFLGVLKAFGAKASPGMLSFPRPGVTLALDFPNSGPALHRLFDRLDAIVGETGGRIYPAKDGRMPGALFRSGYPNWQAFSQYVDPRFSSSLWRRVTALTPLSDNVALRASVAPVEGV